MSAADTGMFKLSVATRYEMRCQRHSHVTV
jgi:hypothetical protein